MERYLSQADWSQETILREASGAFGRPYKLAQVSPGYETAGSARRYTKGGWRVISFDLSGARHSRMFANYSDALSDFETWTKPIIEVRGE